MIRKNKNKNASSDFGKTDFGNLVRFLFLTFALNFKKNLVGTLYCKKVNEVAYLKIRF